jgi:hypothetical protein
MRAEIACCSLIVDALDEEAAGFYRHYGFIPMADVPRMLFLPFGFAPRCHHAGIRKYTYEAAGLIRHDGVNNAEYIERDAQNIMISS